MIKSPITLKFSLIEKDYRALAFWKLLGNKKGYLLIAFIAFLASTTWCFIKFETMLSRGEFLFKKYYLVTFLLFYVGFLIFFSLFIFFRTNAFFLGSRMLKLLFDERKWEFSNEKVLVTAPIGKSDLTWDFFQKFSETKNYFFGFITAQQAHIFPKRVFEDEAQIKVFRKLLKSKHLLK